MASKPTTAQRARRFLADRNHADRGAHPTCFCTTCAEALAKELDATTRRVRREMLAVIREPYSNAVGARNGDSPLLVCRKLERALERATGTRGRGR